jgi:L-ribulose-5-phosphate 3-epimerase
MNRRDLLRLGTATLTAAALSKVSLSQTAPPAQGRATPSGQFLLDVYSRSLQWLRTPQEVTQAVIDTGARSIDLTVMPYPGHVDPTKVKTDLPPFVKTLQSGGVTVSAITCPITDAASPNAEEIIGTASSLGIRHYSWSGFPYQEAQAYQAQLDALKPRVARLAKLNEKYNAKALYQPRQGEVGSVFFDFLDVLRNFDPRLVGFRYDTGLFLQATAQNAGLQLRLGAPYIAGIALNDAVVKLDLPRWNDGAFTGSPKDLVGASMGSGDNIGTDGGDPLAIGGGGRPLPYHFYEVPAGTGMVDFGLIGRILKEINFSGPAECQSDWPLGGAEEGNPTTTMPRLEVLSQLKHNRLMIDQAFATSWNLDIARPPFQMSGGAAAAPGRGEHRGPGPYWPE